MGRILRGVRLSGEAGGVAEEGFEELEVGEVGGDAGDGFDAGGEGREEGVVGAAFHFGEDFADEAEVAVGEEGGLGEDHLVVGGGVVGVGEERGGGAGAADDGGACGHVAEALGAAGADDGDDGHGAAGDGDVHEAERPAQEAVPEGEPLSVEAHHPQAEGLFAEALAVELRLADEVVEQEGQQCHVDVPKVAEALGEDYREVDEGEGDARDGAIVYERGEYAVEDTRGGVFDVDVLGGAD